jgi:hypothetical protein
MREPILATTGQAPPLHSPSTQAPVCCRRGPKLNAVRQRRIRASEDEGKKSSDKPFSRDEIGLQQTAQR